MYHKGWCIQMIKKTNSIIDKHVKENYLPYAVVLFSVLLGVLFGADCVRNISATQKGALVTYLTERLNTISPDLFGHIKANVISALIWGTSIFLCGFSNMLLPLLILIVTTRGFTLGFTSAFLLISSEPVNKAMSLIVPQCIFSIPVILIFSAIVFRQTVKLKNKRDKKSIIHTYCARSFVTIIILLLSAILEGGLSFLMLGIL